MRKKLCLILTLIIFLFMFSGRVDAAKELTCIYKGGLQDYSKMLVQNSAGERFVYVNVKDEVEFDSPNWDDFLLQTDERTFHIEWHSSISSSKFDENGDLLACPLYSKKMENDPKLENYYLSFSDEDTGLFILDYDLDEEYNKLPDLDVYVSFTRDKLDEYNEIIENAEWSAKCTYYATDSEKIHLYFNEDRYMLINEDNEVYSSKVYFTLKQLWDNANEANGCPRRLYEKKSIISSPGSIWVDYYLNNEFSSKEFTITDCVGCENFIPKVDKEKDENVENCKDLFGDELVKKINDVMDIVKIVVPILLIAFGIVDFTKAVFSSSADDMSKCQKKFLKRIVAAVLVFLAPIFINLILTLANNVWENISPDACIGQDN